MFAIAASPFCHALTKIFAYGLLALVMPKQLVKKLFQYLQGRQANEPPKMTSFGLFQPICATW